MCNYNKLLRDKMPFQFLLSIVLILILSCDSPISDNETKYDWRGYVYVFNQYGEELGDRSGVQIGLDGTESYTVTDSSGYWEINNVEGENHSIIYSMNGYSTRVDYDEVPSQLDYYEYKFTGLYQIPTYQITQQNVDDRDCRVVISGTFSESIPGNAVSFLDTDREINFGEEEWPIFSYSTASNPDSFQTVFWKSDLQNVLNIGVMCYVRTFPATIVNGPFGYEVDYYDYESGSTMFFTIGPVPSEIDSFIFNFLPE